MYDYHKKNWWYTTVIPVPVFRLGYLYSYLPQDIQALRDACNDLTKRGIILFLQRNPAENSWIIIERESLLQKVNGTVFAPADFSEHKTLAIHTGVVPLTKIRDCFLNLDTTKLIKTELIIQFLCHMEYCQEIKDTQMLDMLAVHYPQNSEERYFLFPGLITEKVEDLPNVKCIEDLWQPNSYSTYSSKYTLKCHGDGQYLSPRFHQVLLLRQVFAHACPVAAHMEDTANPALQQTCTLWKNGIKWSTTFSVEAMVEVHSRQVTLTLRCKVGQEKALVCLRSKVVSQILAAKEEFCCSTKAVEQLVTSLTKTSNLTVSIANVARSICNQESAALANECPYTPISLGDLLHFEPYMCFSPYCLSLLYSPESQSLPLTQQFIEDACSLHFDDFCKVLNVRPHQVESGSDSSTDYHKVERMFKKWQSSTEETFQCLREHLDKYSLFSGRNIFVSVTVVVCCKF